jgi:hypothetical protein
VTNANSYDPETTCHSVAAAAVGGTTVGAAAGYMTVGAVADSGGMTTETVQTAAVERCVHSSIAPCRHGSADYQASSPMASDFAHEAEQLTSREQVEPHWVSDLSVPSADTQPTELATP